MRSRLIASLSVVALGLVSCVDIPDYDDAPRIEYAGINSYDMIDTSTTMRVEFLRVRFSLDYQDGDGDLGEDTRDSSRINYLENNGGWGNFKLVAYRKVKEQWEVLPLEENSVMIFPVLKTDGVKGPIKGRLEYDMDFFKGRGYKNTPLKFTVQIRDKALRESNVVETDTISVPIFDEF